MLTKEMEGDSSHYKDKETGVELEVQDKQPLLEWLAANYKKFGCTLQFISNKSQEGSQFCRGFGGIGGLLRYQVDLAQFEEHVEGEEDGAGGLWSSDEDIF